MSTTSKHETKLKFEKIVSALLAGAKALEREEWQPIETAPKDGVAVLLFTDMRTIEIGQWSKITNYAGEYEDWCLIGQNGSNMGRFRFSYWRPLPAPPKEVGK